MGTSTPRERWTGYLALAALAAVALGTLLTQADFHPPVHHLRRAPLTTARAAPTDGEALALPPPAAALGPAERFDERTLSDKINGKAELYLACGFRELATRRFAVGRPDAWFEVFLFEMTSPAAAFAAYSQQKRTAGMALEGGIEGYLTENALFAARGRHYLELIGSSADPELIAHLSTAARHLLEPLGEATAPRDPRSLFPLEGLVADSIAFHPRNGIGFEPLDQVYTARYALREGEVTVYLSRRDSAEAAQRLAEEYRAYLKGIGAEDAGEALALYDLFETVGHVGALVYGVHEAPSRELAHAGHERLRQAGEEAP